MNMNSSHTDQININWKTAAIPELSCDFCALFAAVHVDPGKGGSNAFVFVQQSMWESIL